MSEEFDLGQFKRNCVRAFSKLSCVSKEDFGDWARFASVAELSSEEEILNVFCSDCTFQYKKKMISENRCNLPESGRWELN